MRYIICTEAFLLVVFFCLRAYIQKWVRYSTLHWHWLSLPRKFACKDNQQNSKSLWTLSKHENKLLKKIIIIQLKRNLSNVFADVVFMIMRNNKRFYDSADKTTKKNHSHNLFFLVGMRFCMSKSCKQWIYITHVTFAILLFAIKTVIFTTLQQLIIDKAIKF